MHKFLLQQINNNVIKFILMNPNEINKFIKRNKIEQLVLSNSLLSYKSLVDTFNVDNINYNDRNITLFWGLYSFEELNKAMNHKGKKFILWGGNDCLPSKHEFIKDLVNVTIHICLDNNTFQNLTLIYKKVYNLYSFDWNLYLEAYPSLKKHIKTEELARLHYERIGIKEGKSLFGGTIDFDFNWKFYVSYYKDLNMITNEYEAWRHYLLNGKREGRAKNENALNESIDINKENEKFDWILYSRTYPNLKLNNKIEAFNHWIKLGKKEGRSITGGNIDDTFDWIFYKNKYPDISFIKSEREAWIHYVKYGKFEGRKLNENDYSRKEYLDKLKKDNEKRKKKKEEEKKEIKSIIKKVEVKKKESKKQSKRN